MHRACCLGCSSCSVRNSFRLSLPPPLSGEGPHILGPYLHIVILLSQVFIGQKLIDGAGLSPWRKEEEKAGSEGQGAGSVVQGWPDSGPGHGRLGVFLGQRLEWVTWPVSRGPPRSNVTSRD